jgi:hypothetical protein
MWCDGCQRIFGARLTYGQFFNYYYKSWKFTLYLQVIACVLCSTGRGIMTYCSACYNDKKGFCLNYNHPLSPDTSFLQSKCRMAYFPEYLRYCDALNCGKRISGLYFRKSTIHVPLLGSLITIFTCLLCRLLHMRQWQFRYLPAVRYGR